MFAVSGHDASFGIGALLIGLTSYWIVPTLAWLYAFTMYFLPCGLRSHAPLQGTLPADGPPDGKHAQ